MVMDGLKDFFTGTKGSKGSGEIVANTRVGLTPLGSSKLDSGSLQGQYYEVAAAIKDEGNNSSLGELAQASHIPIYKLKFLIKTMIARSYVRRVGADEA